MKPKKKEMVVLKRTVKSNGNAAYKGDKGVVDKISRF